MRSVIAYWRNKKKYQFLGKIGRIVSFTKVSQPASGFGKIPYIVAIISFGKGRKQTAQLVIEGKRPEINGKVVGVIRRINVSDKQGIIKYGVKFKVI